MKKNKISIKISTKILYVGITLILLLSLIVGVYASTQTRHSITDFVPGAGCRSNQTIMWNGTSLICVFLPRKGATAYQVTNSYCVGTNTINISSSCATKLCSTLCGSYGCAYTYYTCSGSCSESQSQTCQNSFKGYLANPNPPN